MTRALMVLVLAILSFYAYGQDDQPSNNMVADDVSMIDTITLDEGRIYSKTHESDYVDTEANHQDHVGKGIIIQNGFPRGGGRVSNDIDYGMGYSGRELLIKEIHHQEW